MCGSEAESITMETAAVGATQDRTDQVLNGSPLAFCFFSVDAVGLSEL